MNWILIFVVSAFIVQILIFFFTKKRKQEENSIIFKYNIRNAADAFRLLNSHSIPEADRLEIEKYYQEERP